MQHTPSIADRDRSTDLSLADVSQTSSYRDAQLHTLIKSLRAACWLYPHSKTVLECDKARLKYMPHVLEASDASHAEQAELLISLGNIPSVSGEVSLIFNQDRCQRLLRRCLIGGDEQVTDWMMFALEVEREVLV